MKRRRKIEKEVYVVEYEGRKIAVDAFDPMAAIMETMKNWLEVDEEVEVRIWNRSDEERVEKYDVHRTEEFIHIFEKIEM